MNQDADSFPLRLISLMIAGREKTGLMQGSHL